MQNSRKVKTIAIMHNHVPKAVPEGLCLAFFG